jgi:hypothetical protein
VRKRIPGWTLGLLLLAVACGQSREGDAVPDAAAWSRRLRADASTRDAALVELRKRKAEGIPCVLALLDDPEVARTQGHDAIREELVYVLGEAGTTSSEVQERLIRILADPEADVGVALAAARGLFVSWRVCHDLPLLEAYIALLRRVARAEDARKAASVNGIAHAGCPLPYEPGFVNALRAGTADLKSCAYCLGELRRFAGHQAELVGLYRQIAARLETQPPSEDAVVEAEKLTIREMVGSAITEAGGN